MKCCFGKKVNTIVCFVFAVIICSAFFGFEMKAEEITINEMETRLYTGEQGKMHIQGIAIDRQKEYLYYSFTNKLIKADLQGNIVGSISGFTGHIGCIAYNSTDGKVYASLEYKHDVIGQNVIEQSSAEIDFDDGFYIALFDVDKIENGNYDLSEHPDMLKTVHLTEVLNDYKGKGKNLKGDTVDHKYGCSGIDGLCIAPLPGEKKNKVYLYVAYGIYSDINREDNDYQVMLCYDLEEIAEYAEIFNQESMHRSGPEAYSYKFFVYTGNTKFGVQNMAYDEKSEVILLAAYPGKKESFENYTLFAIDMNIKPEERNLKGVSEKGPVLSLKAFSSSDNENTSGIHSDLGAYGMCYITDGYYYLSESINNNGIFSAEINMYSFDTERGFQLVEE